jgi:hypothetical protein
MTYTIMVLEDSKTAYDLIKFIISQIDRDAQIMRVDTIDQAKKELKQRTDVAFIIVDLILNEPVKEKGGDDFVEWVLNEELTLRTSILIVSQCHTMIAHSKKKFQNLGDCISFAHRTNDYNPLFGEIQLSIENALRKYGGS